MNKIKVNSSTEIPENYTGIVEFSDGTKQWCKYGERHREDGPAIEFPNGYKEWRIKGKLHREDGPAVEFPTYYNQWWLEDKQYFQININDYIALDYSKGEYNLMWYKLLGKDRVFEYPDIPGLITK